MNPYTDLRTGLRAAREVARKKFESSTRQPSLSVLPGGGRIDGIVDAIEFGAMVMEAYTEVFRQQDPAFVRGYVQGRRGNPLNLFSRQYRAARRALAELEQPVPA